jgi:asparagine synthase (glutamine-hydrolysing)
VCGICGIAAPGINRRVDDSLLVRMRDALTHRGPDDAGLFIQGSIGLGHRRLSIVDLAGGHQPMNSEDNRSRIVYNGEVYNHRQLRSALEARGHRYRTSSDTETIIHLYDEYGPGAVSHLRGMFAFAIWDGRKRQLLLARDRFGVKPLYYTLSDDGTIFFASEIKALLVAGAVKAELNYDALADYAANRATSGEETLFVRVKRLLPGHPLVWKDGQVEFRRYWHLSYSKPARRFSDNHYIAEFTRLFRESVELRLMADVPLGMFLPGGIDSAAIAAVMSELVAEPVKTFSVAFAEREANELEYARLVAAKFHTDHHEVIVAPEQFFEALPALVYQEDEPIAHPSSVALYFVSRLAARHVKVVLTGEGSDELLAGYNKYRATILNLALGRAYQRLVPARSRRWIADQLAERLTNARLRQRSARTFLRLPSDLQHLYFDNFAVFPREMQERLFTAETRERMRERDPYRTAFSFISEADAGSLLDQLLAADSRTYLHELLMKQDQMSMAASIESRVPFLDHKLAEFIAALPERLKLRGLTTKYILREAMRHTLPRQILRRRKMGFPVPVGAWLRGRFNYLLDEYLDNSRARARRLQF